MNKGGFVNKGRCQFVWDPDHLTAEQYLDEMADEIIDYMLALQKIVEYDPVYSKVIAQAALERYGKGV